MEQEKVIVELSEIIRDYTAVERNMIDDFMKGKKLVKIDGEPHAYRWK